MRKKRKKPSKQLSPERERFRKEFYERMSTAVILSISKETGIAQDTLYSWKSAGKGLPDIEEAQRIARAMKCSPSWLAFNESPSPEEQRFVQRLRLFAPTDRARLEQFVARLEALAELERTHAAQSGSPVPAPAGELPGYEEMTKRGRKLLDKDFDAASEAADDERGSQRKDAPQSNDE